MQLVRLDLSGHVLGGNIPVGLQGLHCLEASENNNLGVFKQVCLHTIGGTLNGRHPTMCSVQD